MVWQLHAQVNLSEPSSAHQNPSLARADLHQITVFLEFHEFSDISGGKNSLKTFTCMRCTPEILRCTCEISSSSAMLCRLGYICACAYMKHCFQPRMESMLSLRWISRKGTIEKLVSHCFSQTPLWVSPAQRKVYRFHPLVFKIRSRPFTMLSYWNQKVFLIKRAVIYQKSGWCFLNQCFLHLVNVFYTCPCVGWTIPES